MKLGSPQFYSYQQVRFSYLDFGNPSGFPILIQHGMVASILDTRLFSSLIEAGFRLISIARPGYGESSPYSLRNIAEWGDIVCELVDELHLQSFDVLGMSSGAPYSYSIGFRLPEKARNIYIFSGIPALYDDGVAACWPYPISKDAALPEMQILARELFFSGLSAIDIKRDDIRASMMNNCFGPGLDLQIRGQDWGFTLPEVKQFVFMQHSRQDNFAAAELTSRLLPDCQLDTRGGDHFSPELLEHYLKFVAAHFLEQI